MKLLEERGDTDSLAAYLAGGTGEPTPSVTLLEGNRARVHLHEPQRAVTPGQAAVIYDGDVVLGGGWICRAEPARRYEAAVLA